ncbi:MAG: MGMT family protein [Actinomycetota bacterium]|nr:MGMT family protein [Actinomycetota bacterium]MDQ3430917.1 MGMT family protein [Actinomycetota bacterium]
MSVDREALIEQVLDLVEAVPPGRATTYGALADAVGFGGPRWIGSVLSRHGAAVPWWRVVRADGTLPPSHRTEAVARYKAEGTPLRTTPDGRVVGVDFAATP